MANGNGNSVANITAWVIRCLIVAGLIGIASIATTQATMGEKVAANTAGREKAEPILNGVDVMQKDIQYLREDYRDLKRDIGNKHAEVLRAIGNIQ